MTNAPGRYPLGLAPLDAPAIGLTPARRLPAIPCRTLRAASAISTMTVISTNDL